MSASLDGLQRSAAAPDFLQRFTGRLDEGGNTLVGRWQHSSDGSNWEDDFGITYTRLRRQAAQLTFQSEVTRRSLPG